jgi:predicted nucleic acid-binding protein
MNAKPGVQFVDTNVLVYAYDLAAGNKHQLAKELFGSLWEEHSGCLSVQVLQEFYINITRRVPRPLAPEKAAEIIQDLMAWKVYAPQAGDVLAAINLQRHYRLSFWDAMIIQSAAAAGCQTIWSEDLSDSRIYAGLDVRNPFSVR